MLLETGWNPESLPAKSVSKQMHNLPVNGTRLVKVGKLVGKVVIGIQALAEERYVKTLHISDFVCIDLMLIAISRTTFSLFDVRLLVHVENTGGSKS